MSARVDELAFDTLVGWPDRFYVNNGEDDITELGIRATKWSIEENEGIGLALLLEEIFGEEPAVVTCPRCHGIGKVSR